MTGSLAGKLVLISGRKLDKCPILQMSDSEKLVA